jgi:membrane protein YdbS with pleckstrin-like domain
VNPIFSAIRFYSLCFGCFLCGAMMAEVLDSIARHQLGVFCQQHPVQIWLAPVVSLLVIFLLARRTRQIKRAKALGAVSNEKVAVKHYVFFTTFSATPLVRIWIYAGMYGIGLCMIFIL